MENVNTIEDVTIYLLHLDSPMIKSGNSHPQHYLGSAKNLEGRLYHHRKGSGSKFLREANERGIAYSIAADWGAKRQLEMCMKQTKNLQQFCPVCMGAKAKNPLTFPFRSLRRCSHLPENHPVSLIIASGDTEIPQVYNNTTEEENVPETAHYDITGHVQDVEVYNPRPTEYYDEYDDQLAF